MPMTILLLAAGCGVRLGDKTRDTPKTLLHLANRPILHHILCGVAAVSSLPLVVVTGFEAEQIHDAVNGHYPKISFAHNADFTKGNILSLTSARALLGASGFVMFNADHVYSKEILAKIFAPTDQITAVCDFDRPLIADDMKVVMQNKSPILFSKQVDQNLGGYVGCTIVPPNKVDTYWKMVDHTLSQVGEKANVEEVLNRLIKAGEPIAIRDVSGSTWIEVDTPEDLKLAEQKIHQMGLLG